MERITSLTNNKVKEMVLLVTKAKERRRTDTYVVEGRKMFLESPPEELVSVFVAEQLTDGERADETILSRISEIEKKNVPVYQVTDEILRKMSDTQTPQGIMCVLRQKHYSLEQMLKKEHPLLVVLEDLQDPGNLGTILRTGEGAGIDGVILSKDSVDLYNPKTIRATMGSIFRVPFIYVEELAQTIEMLKTAGVRTYAAHLQESEYYDALSFTEGCAFLIGNEGNGLKRETANLADQYLKIPMQGQVESLNAAIATTILMYEASRQRRKQ